MKKSVLITNRIPEAAYRLLKKSFSVTWSKRQLSERELAAKIPPFHGLLSTLADPITQEVLSAAAHLECVANYAVGFNNIDLGQAKQKGIWVTNTPDVLTEATADIAWALILSCARRVPEGEKNIRTNAFKGWDALFLRGMDLAGKTLGLYGFGRIGQAVARRGRGWNMKILYHQRHRENPRIEKRLGAKFVPFESLLRQSDILSLHAPLTPETRHRFGRKEFEKMGPNSIFINTARGGLHNERELVQALKRGPLFSAGLDVYEFEPKIDPALLKLPNCTLLPHLGSATYETRNRMALLAAENIQAVLMGKAPKTPVFNLKKRHSKA